MIPVIWICRDSCAIDTNQFPAERGTDVCRSKKVLSAVPSIRAKFAEQFFPSPPFISSTSLLPSIFSLSFFFSFIYNLGDNAHANQHFLPFSLPPSRVWYYDYKRDTRGGHFYDPMVRKLFSIFHSLRQTNFTPSFFSHLGRRKEKRGFREVSFPFLFSLPAISFSPNRIIRYFYVTYIRVYTASWRAKRSSLSADFARVRWKTADPVFFIPKRFHKQYARVEQSPISKWLLNEGGSRRVFCLGNFAIFVNPSHRVPRGFSIERRSRPTVPPS